MTAAPAESTRDALLDTALRLYAERGVFTVSLNEIVRESGQRNASAVHYHFGGREQLLVELLEPTVRWLHARRRELLTLAHGSDDPQPVVEAIVAPLVEVASQGWRQRAWMRIGLQLAAAPERVGPEIAALLPQAGGTEALALLRTRCPPLPDEVWSMRTDICIDFVGRAAVARALSIDEGRGPAMSDAAFTENLVAMFIAALTADGAGAVARPAATGRQEG